MSNHSVIEHRANYHYIKVEEDLIAICLGGKANPHCKALILAILEGWTNTKRDKGESPEIYMTYPQWIKATYWLYGRNVIIEALLELESDSFISKRPYRTHGRDTFIYTLNVKAVQDEIRLLPEKKPDDYLPSFNLNAFKNKRVPNQTRPKSNGKTEKGVYYQTADAFNKGRNITYTTNLQSHIPSESITDETASTTIVPVGTARADFSSEQEIDDDPEKTLHRTPAIPKGQRDDTGDNHSHRSSHTSNVGAAQSTRNTSLQPSHDDLETISGRAIGDDRVAANVPAQQSHSAEHARAVVTPEASPPSTSGVPSQQTLMETEKPARARQKPTAKSGKNIPNPIPAPKGPPVEPPADMPWGTRKCLQWFDFWRGGVLIGKFKLMQASTCAKGLAEQFSEEQVIQARSDMAADPYYIARGGCDVCDVAANIHKYLKRRQGQMGAASRAVILAGYTDYTSGPALALKPMKRVRT